MRGLPRSARIALFFAANVVALGCSSITELGVEGSTGEAEPPGSTTTGLLPTGVGTGDGTTEAGTSSSSGASSMSTGVDPSGDEDGCNFVGCGPDVPGIPACDIWNDDCPRGERCTFWSTTGGSTIDSTRCVPLEPDPAGPGEACTAEALGFDNCEAGSMCWYVDEGVGECVPFCVGSPEAPTCDEPTRVCSVSGGPLTLCIPMCDPLEPEPCPEGQGCYPASDSLLCAPDASGDGGGTFEPCEFTNACDPGLACLGATEVGACPGGAANCCTPYCDLQAPTCPQDTVCIAVYETGEAPPDYENLGVCGAP